MKTVGVVRFLGTNCDRDVWQAVEWAGHKPQWLWYQDRFDLSKVDALVIPGGFSYGDYLRCGALASKAPVMSDVRTAATRGVPVLGICNGFQVLCESGLLPGALVRNQGLRFRDAWVELKQENKSPHFQTKTSVRLPIAHGEGRYVNTEEGVKALRDSGQIWWTYSENPNGSLENIAGVFNKTKNVAGLMPHPERAVAAWMGAIDGLDFFKNF
jgi:phosphoribosylformylglycinamidine synthase I